MFFRKISFKNIALFIILINEILVLSLILWFIIKAISYSSSKLDGALLDQLNSDTIIYNKLYVAITLIINSIFLLIKTIYIIIERKSFRKPVLIFIPIISVFIIIVNLSKKDIKINSKNIFLPLLTFLFPLSIFITFAFSFNKESNDNPSVTYKPISFSKNQMNVIEIFSDGLDPINLQKSDSFKNLNGFHFFPKVAEKGAYTQYGMGDMFHGEYLRHSIRSAIQQKMNFWEHKLPNQDNAVKTIIGVSDVSSPNTPNNYVGGWSGNGRTLEQMPEIQKSNIKVLNWSRARNDMYEKHGDINWSPYSAQYEDFLDDIHRSDDHPSFTQIMENMTHHPIMINETGDMHPIFRINADKDAAVYLVSYLKRLEEKLKALDVFDKTLIAVYGDHASHTRTPTPLPFKENIDSLKPISALLVKPINSGNSTNPIVIHDDMTVDSKFIRRIIRSNYDQTSSFTNWLSSDEVQKNFKNPNRVYELLSGDYDDKKIWFYKVVKNNSNQWVATSAFKSRGSNQILKHGGISWYKYNSNEARAIIKEERINSWIS